MEDYPDHTYLSTFKFVPGQVGKINFILSFFILINVSIQMSLFLANSYGNLINTHKFCLLRISGIVSDILPMVYPLVVQFVFHFQLK